MYILTILKCPLKTNINALYNQISMNIFFTQLSCTHLGFNVLKMLKKNSSARVPQVETKF